MVTSPLRLSLSFVVVDCTDEMLGDAVDIASALRDRGHTITVAASRAMAGRAAAAGFPVTPLPAERLGRVDGLDHWLRATATDAVHLFGHGGVWSTATAARLLRVPLYWTVGDRAPASVPPVGVLIAYGEHVGRRLVANRRLRLEHVVVEPARMDCAAPAERRSGDAIRAAMGLGAGCDIVVATSPAEPATLAALYQAAAAVTRLRREGHDVLLLHVGGGSAAGRLRRVLERQASGTSVAPAADVPPSDLLRVAAAVLGSGRGAYRGMLADRPTLVLGANGYAGDCTAAQVELLAPYDFTGANVRRRDDRVGVADLMASLRPLLERRADTRVWLGNGWARARVGADVAAVTYEHLYVRRRPVPRGGSAAVLRYEAARVVMRPARVLPDRPAVCGPLRPRAARTLDAAPAPAATRGTVVHAFSDGTAPVTPAQIDAVLRLHDEGWRATVVLPSTDGWSRAAQVCAHAGAQVERFPGVGSGEVAALWYGARAAAILRDRMRQWDGVAVHAHDDAAVLVWGLAARTTGVPLVWDADLDLRPQPLDRLRFALASYLVATGRGRRLTIDCRLPPHHRRAGHPPAEARAMAAVLERLTGRRPVDDSSGMPDAAVAPVVPHDRVDVGR